jgi:hypothetical protein
MKQFFIAALFIGFMASCDVYYVEPRYDYRDQVTGYYDVEDYSETFEEYHYYNVRVTKASSRSSAIYLNDLYTENTQVLAYLDGNSITIPSQLVDGYEIEGYGSITSSSLTLSYVANDRYGNRINDFCELYGNR